MSLNSGERQVAPTISGIRRDHVARYEWAAKMLPPDSCVMDFGCGIGYGARILADAGHTVFAVDRDEETIAFAKQHYSHPGITFVGPGEMWRYRKYDAVICFEMIEHVKDPGHYLTNFSEKAPLLLASVPNEDVFPFKNYAFHHRHYRRSEFDELLRSTGFEVDMWFGQMGPESEVEPDVNGRTLIAVAQRSAASKSIAPEPDARITTSNAAAAPEHVAIVGLGPSCATFFELTRRMGGVSAWCDEVWGINAIGDVLRCDRVFHMDDIKVQELRAAANPSGNIAAMVKWLKCHPGPIYTSVTRPGYPGLVAYPLEAVLNSRHDSNGGAPYFNSTAAYAIAYAVHIGVKRISLFGLDYTLPNSHKAEQGRACCEFWLGIAAARGIEITLPDTTSLLDACATDRDRLYGYDCVDVALVDQSDGSVRVAMTDRADIPTAAEIEQRYNHTDHPNPLMRQR